jgi:hypothetical protein
MKRKHLAIVLLVCLFSSVSAVNYYSRGSSPIHYLNNLDAWRTNRDGSGSAPPNFFLPNQVFHVQAGHALTALGDFWSVSGAGSYVVVEDEGRIVSGPYDHQITIRVQNGGTYEVSNTSYSQLIWNVHGILEPNSNFVLNDAGISFNSHISYGNLIVLKGVAELTGPLAGFEIKGTLTVQESGTFIGGGDMETVLSIGNIVIGNGGVFMGSDGMGNTAYNVSGSISVAGGYFYGSGNEGGCIYNIGDDLTISDGYFWACFRDFGNLPSNVFNIGGNFTRTGGFFASTSSLGGGFTLYNLTGTGKSIGIGNIGADQDCWHRIVVAEGASYTLTDDIPVYSNQVSIRGTLNASARQIIATGPGVTVEVYGTFVIPNAEGFCFGADTSIADINDPGIVLWGGCTVEYRSASAQTITARTDYQSLTLSGNGAKHISGPATVVHTALNLDAGTLYTNGFLMLEDDATINRGAGSLSGEPVFLGHVNVNYLENATTGAEIPSNLLILNDLTIFDLVEVNAGSDIQVNRNFILREGCVLHMQDYWMYLPPEVQILHEMNAQAWGRYDLASRALGLDAPALGISFPSDDEIPPFTIKHWSERRFVESIRARFDAAMEGDYQREFKLIWYPDQDEEIQFSPINRAIAWKLESRGWVQVGQPQDVSGMNPRQLTLVADINGEWAITGEDTTLPVVLSSFTAVTTGQNTVSLNWVTQSESNMLGYYLFRNKQEDFASAVCISELIGATNTSIQQVYNYQDTEITSAGTYYYWLQSVEMNLWVNTYGCVMATVDFTGQDPGIPPVPLPVIHAYPNPFNPAVRIQLNQTEDSFAELAVFDARGRKVRTIFTGSLNAGIHVFEWDARDDCGTMSASGVYLITFKSNGQNHLRKIALSK